MGIKETALWYAHNEMGREVEIVKTLDHGSHAMALCWSRDDGENFALVLAASIATHEWSVVDETDVEDFHRNDPDHQ